MRAHLAAASERLQTQPGTERAADLTGRREAAVLDALGAAYAAAGRFDAAVAAERSAIDRATGTGLNALLPEFKQRLALYEQQRPFVMPRP